MQWSFSRHSFYQTLQKKYTNNKLSSHKKIVKPASHHKNYEWLLILKLIFNLLTEKSKSETVLCDKCLTNSKTEEYRLQAWKHWIQLEWFVIRCTIFPKEVTTFIIGNVLYAVQIYWKAWCKTIILHIMLNNHKLHLSEIVIAGRHGLFSFLNTLKEEIF